MLIVRSWPAYPDMVAIGEAYAERYGGELSVAALAAGPFLPTMTQQQPEGGFTLPQADME